MEASPGREPGGVRGCKKKARSAVDTPRGQVYSIRLCSADVAQSAEQPPCKRQVEGSSPSVSSFAAAWQGGVR